MIPTFPKNNSSPVSPGFPAALNCFSAILRPRLIGAEEIRAAIDAVAGIKMQGILIAIALLEMIVPLGACAQENETANATGSIPPEVIAYAGNWPLPNYDYANSRATMNSAIDAGTVNDLGVAWAFAIPATSAYGAASSNPILMGDTVYFQDLNASVFALDLRNGSEIWAHRLSARTALPSAGGRSS